MRILSFILSVYFLLLACIACSDVKEVHAAGLQTASVSCSDIHLSHAHDACTPLCCCSCCQGTITSPSAKFEIKVLTRVNSILNTTYLFYTKDVILPFWQPPKIQC